MSEEKDLEECPVCHSPAIAKRDDATGTVTYDVTILPQQIALALDNEAVARKVISILPMELRLALAQVMLEGPIGADGYFTTQDVEDEAEAGLRALDVAKELRLRNRNDEARHFQGLSERHQKRAIKITGLITEAEQLMIKQRVHGGPIGNGSAPHIQIVKS